MRSTSNKPINRPVGSTKNHPVDIRIVAATRRDLTEEASMGNFREGLFYRLDVVNMKIPPLRDRKEDFPLLAAHFIEYLSNDFQVTASLRTRSQPSKMP